MAEKRKPAAPAKPARPLGVGVASERLRITQVRSQIGETERHRGTLRALGLGRVGRAAEHEESPQLAGMLRKVAHLVRVEKL